jgi:hypothetical protein
MIAAQEKKQSDLIKEMSNKKWKEH